MLGLITKQLRTGFTTFECEKVVVVQLLSHIQLFVTPWTAACQASLSFTMSQSLLKFTSISWLCYLTISSSAILFSFCLKSFPASRSFPKNQLFASDGQSIGASATVLPVNIQECFPLGWTGWISLMSKGLSRAFSSIMV